VERKADRSPVTIADRTIEEFLRRELARAFPGEVIVGEELGLPPGWTQAGPSAQPRATYWTVDPIDGTRAFSRGLPTWGTLIGRVEQGKPVLGACRFPALKTFIGVGLRTPPYERQGRRRVLLPRAPRPPALRDAAIFHGGSKWWMPTPYWNGFQRLVKSCFLERAYGDCAGHLWLFRGYVDAVIEYGVKVWDIAPMAAFARATGRVMCDFSGRPSFSGPQMILAHPSFAKQIVQILHG
jgi:histidinol-phosphatase